MPPASRKCSQVEEPVGSSRHRHSLGPNGQRVDFSCYHPSQGAPGSSEPEEGGKVRMGKSMKNSDHVRSDEDADKGNENLLSSGISITDGSSNRSDYKLRNGHGGGTDEEERSTPQFTEVVVSFCAFRGLERKTYSTAQIPGTVIPTIRTKTASELGLAPWGASRLPLTTAVAMLMMNGFAMPEFLK